MWWINRSEKRDRLTMCVTPFALCYAMCVRAFHSRLWRLDLMFGSISVCATAKAFTARAHFNHEKWEKWEKEIWMPETNNKIIFLIFLLVFFFGVLKMCAYVFNTVDDSVVHAIWYNNISMVSFGTIHTNRWTVEGISLWFSAKEQKSTKNYTTILDERNREKKMNMYIVHVVEHMLEMYIYLCVYVLSVSFFISHIDRLCIAHTLNSFIYGLQCSTGFFLFRF